MAFKRTLELVVVQCCSCHVEYALPQGLVNRLHSEKEKRSTWCPNGHQWHYVGKSDATRLREAEQALALTQQRLREAGQGRAHREPCPVCGLRFERLNTHRTLMKHWKPATLKAL